MSEARHRLASTSRTAARRMRCADLRCTAESDCAQTVAIGFAPSSALPFFDNHLKRLNAAHNHPQQVVQIRSTATGSGAKPKAPYEVDEKQEDLVAGQTLPKTRTRSERKRNDFGRVNEVSCLVDVTIQVELMGLRPGFRVVVCPPQVGHELKEWRQSNKCFINITVCSVKGEWNVFLRYRSRATARAFENVATMSILALDLSTKMQSNKCITLVVSTASQQPGRSNKCDDRVL